VSDLQDKRILVVDDDPELLRLVEICLSVTKAQVYTAPDGQMGLRQFFLLRPDLVVLDVMMPDLDGWQVCQHVRLHSDVPILFLTAMGREEDVVRGLDCGAVDYVTKPFSPRVLVARVRAALRRRALTPGPDRPPTHGYSDGHLTVDLDAHRVLVRGQPVRLTAKEYQLLACLLRNAGRVLTYRQILEEVWGWEYQNNADYAHVYMWRLRKKLERDPRNPQYLLTEHGVGYRFQELLPVKGLRSGQGHPHRETRTGLSLLPLSDDSQD